MENKEKHFHSKFKIYILCILAIIIILLLATYTTNQNFRKFIDNKIFNKQVTENSLVSIEINSDDNPISFAYSNLIGIYAKNNLNIYNKNAEKIGTLTLNITSPIIGKNGKFLVIAEKNGSDFYVINNSSILWQSTVDGNISKISINPNGFVSIITSTSAYKSIVVVFDSTGNKLFTNYLPSSSYGVCTSISSNNSYLAIGEIDYSGTVIKSYVKIISIDLAQTNAKESIVYKKEISDNIITNIQYYDKENAICMLKDSVIKVSPKDSTELFKTNDNILFLDINVDNNISLIEKQSSGLFSYDYDLKFIKTNSSSENIYILENKLPKQVIADYNSIALNYGNSVDIIDKNGWLEKTYTSSQQIKDLIIGDKIVGIVYKDKIEIIDF